MFWIEFDLGGACSPAFRFSLLNRLSRCSRARDVGVRGFRVDVRLAALLEGESTDVVAAVRATKVGTGRCRYRLGRLGPTRRWAVVDPKRALVALHAGPQPLANPWTSHRDLMGFRRAGFFDAGWWSWVDRRWVHVEAGGGPMPEPAVVSATPERCLRVAATLTGVLPESGKCRRLYAHLGKAAGIRQVELADALLLSPRRIRQLQAEPEPLLQVAMKALGDWRFNESRATPGEPSGNPWAA